MSTALQRTCTARCACSNRIASAVSVRRFQSTPRFPLQDVQVESLLDTRLFPLRANGEHLARSVAPQERTDGFFTPSVRWQSRNTSLVAFGPFRASGGKSPQQKPESTQEGRVSDHEYSVRVGQAFDLLRATIPDFMRIGLVDYDGTQPTSSSSSMTLMDTLTFRALRARASTDAENVQKAMEKMEQSSSSANSASSYQDDPSSLSKNQVYHPRIHFRFCAGNRSGDNPSSADLTEAEAASLSFSGRSLYFASAHVLRHTLNILFTHPRVEVERIRLEKRGRGRAWCDQTLPSDDKVGGIGDTVQPHGSSRGSAHGGGGSGDAIHLRVRFSGNLRVTGMEHQYTVTFRYDIDGETGRIGCHTVERIEPAIGRKLWTVITTVWERITGHTRMPEPTPMPAPCVAHQDRTAAKYRRAQRNDAAQANVRYGASQ